MTTTTTPTKTRKPRTPEQIAARKAKSKARREARKQFIPVTDENRALLQAGFASLMDAFEKGQLDFNHADNLIALRIRKQQTPEQLQAKLEKERKKLARLEAALKAATKA